MGDFKYKYLFSIAQNKGKYHMFVFDIKKSKSYGKETGNIEKTSRILIKNIYHRLEEIEAREEKVILHRNPDFVDMESDTMLLYLCEPFNFLGDLYGFTTIRDSISNEEVYKIYLEEKEKLKIYWDFNIIDGYYETDNYSNGDIEYFRGNCIQQLEELSKRK